MEKERLKHRVQGMFKVSSFELSRIRWLSLLEVYAITLVDVSIYVGWRL